jgi:hypothetical protein
MALWFAWSYVKQGAPQDGRATTSEIDRERSQQRLVRFGVSIQEPSALPGYTLLAPLKSTKTYLIDMQGRVVRTWESNTTPALGACLLPNGHLLRAGALPGVPGSDQPGAGGRVQEFTWEGELVWDFRFGSGLPLPHHDVARLPNGNVLMIAWERKTIPEALAAGRRRDLVNSRYVLIDCLLEVKPTSKTTGEVVWEWHLWDHLVQDYSRSAANYGNVAEHPELVDVNYGENVIGLIASTKSGMDKLRSIGYVGSSAKSPPSNPDWSHVNAVAYNPDLDQIMVTSLPFSEFWIIDHSTTRAQAAGHYGGRSGRGGDLLYRWGNPRAYRAGTKADQRLFAPHDAHWIPRALPGGGHVLVFNNGPGRPDGRYSSVDELVLPVDSAARFARRPPAAYGPDQPIWSYTAPNKSDFFSLPLSGAQRLPNGNTLICSGGNGTLLEVTPQKQIVWKYITPAKDRYEPSGPRRSEPYFGPQGGEPLFRAYRYGLEYTGLVGKNLIPSETVKESQP